MPPVRLQTGATSVVPRASTDAAPTTPKSNDEVLFIAVNNSFEHKSTFESDQLKARGTRVTVVQDATVNDTITTKDARGKATTHDLTTPEGRLAFALTLKLPAEQTQKIADAIGAGGEDAKDELAQIAQVWAKAERGEPMPSRLVLSGHHVGYGVYGENNGSLDWPVVKGLTDAMPRAARATEDLMIAGCYSGGQADMEKYQAMFPNVKTITAYSGSSPGSYSGATAHQKAWEKATRGSGDGIDRDIFAGMRKGENVTVWTKTHGFDDGQPPRSIESMRGDVEEGRIDYEQALRGDLAIPDAQSGVIRDFYSKTQRLLQHPDLPASEKPALEATRDQTIRLLFYPVVSKRFAETYGDKITAGYQSLGLAAPDFKTLSRKDALKAISDFQTAMAAKSPVPDAAAAISQKLSDFKDLKKSVIPDTWV